MSAPRRLRRRVGQAYPPNAVFVGRGSMWENPFESLESVTLTDEQVAELYDLMISGIWNPDVVANLDDEQYARVYARRTSWVKRLERHPLEMARIRLRGRDLLCWCREDDPRCHADILLRAANS